MAGRAAKLCQRVRNRRMFAECYGANIGETGFLQAEVAGGATVCHLLFGYPYLLDAALEVPFQGDGVGASADETQILLLIMAPLAEVVLGRRDGQQHKQDDACRAEGASAVAEEELPQGAKFILHASLTPPEPNPRPSRTAEESADGGQHDQFEHEPCHDPERERFTGQPTAKPLRRLWIGLRCQKHECSDDDGRNECDPDIKDCQKNTKHYDNNAKDAQTLCLVVQPQSFGLDVNVEVRDDDERDNN